LTLFRWFRYWILRWQIRGVNFLLFLWTLCLYFRRLIWYFILNRCLSRYWVGGLRSFIKGIIRSNRKCLAIFTLVVLIIKFTILTLWYLFNNHIIITVGVLINSRLSTFVVRAISLNCLTDIKCIFSFVGSWIFFIFLRKSLAFCF
jgi:hypothetical protein